MQEQHKHATQQTNREEYIETDPNNAQIAQPAIARVQQMQMGAQIDGVFAERAHTLLGIDGLEQMDHREMNEKDIYKRANLIFFDKLLDAVPGQMKKVV